MEITRGWPTKPFPVGLAVAIGNFDGLHLGHARVISHLRAEAARRGLESAVLTFDPHPTVHFLKAAAPALLTLPERKAELLAATGVDHLWVLPFDAELANLEPEVFAQYLARFGQLGLAVVGFNFTFGRGGRATAGDLEQALKPYGAEVLVEEPLLEGGEVVSSTRIRRLLDAGQVGEAGRLLGRPYGLTGTVSPGDRRGRTLGFPTANLGLDPRQLRPETGVYAVEVSRTGGEVFGGMANLGWRPTFAGTEVSLEVHLFDFSGDLYGQEISVAFLARLRAERRFTSASDLMAQLRTDSEEARRFLAHRKVSSHGV